MGGWGWGLKVGLVVATETRRNYEENVSFFFLFFKTGLLCRLKGLCRTILVYF